MLTDYRAASFAPIRSKLSSIATPFYYLVDGSLQLLKGLRSDLTTQQKLIETNAVLRAQELMLTAQLQALKAKEKDYQHIQNLVAIQSAQHPASNTFLPAHLLAVDLNASIQQLLIDKGRHDGVYVGQPVIDGYGIIGQVISVGESTSRILLITDTHSAIPVQIERTGFRAIALGQGNTGLLSLSDITDTTDLKVGDHVITSGLGLRYPAGYLIGEIKTIASIRGHRFALTLINPSAHLHKGNQVLLIWQKKNLKQLQKTIHQQRYAPLPGHKEKPMKDDDTTYQHTTRY